MNAPDFRKALAGVLALPLGPSKVAGLVALGRQRPESPAQSDAVFEARKALLLESPEVEVEGVGSVITKRGTMGGIGVFFTYVSRVSGERPARASSTTRILSSAAETHLWSVADLLDDSKL